MLCCNRRTPLPPQFAPQPAVTTTRVMEAFDDESKKHAEIASTKAACIQRYGNPVFRSRVKIFNGWAKGFAHFATFA